MAFIRQSRLARLLMAALLVVGGVTVANAAAGRDYCDEDCPQYGCSISVDCPSGCDSGNPGDCFIEFDPGDCEQFFQCDCPECYIVH